MRYAEGPCTERHAVQDEGHAGEGQRSVTRSRDTRHATRARSALQCSRRPLSHSSPLYQRVCDRVRRTRTRSRPTRRGSSFGHQICDRWPTATAAEGRAAPILRSMSTARVVNVLRRSCTTVCRRYPGPPTRYVRTSLWRRRTNDVARAYVILQPRHYAGRSL